MKSLIHILLATVIVLPLPISANTEIAELRAELKDKIGQYITLIAIEQGVDPVMALGIAHCESGLNHLAVGDNGKSFGLWQIHLPSHPGTKEMALDPVKSTDWAIPRLKETPEIWTCYRKLAWKTSNILATN